MKILISSLLFVAVVFGWLISASADGTSARIASIPEDTSEPIMQEMFSNIRSRGGGILNIHRVLGNAPKLARAYNGLAFAIRFDATTSRRDRELAIVRTAQILQSRYELNQHLPLALACGFTEAQVSAVPNWRTSPLYGEKERAVLAYTEEVVEKASVSDATFAQLTRFYNEREIVELTITIGAYASTAMITGALAIRPENDGRRSAPGEC